MKLLGVSPKVVPTLSKYLTKIDILYGYEKRFNIADLLMTSGFYFRAVFYRYKWNLMEFVKKDFQ